jgi:hypothetical protein
MKKIKTFLAIILLASPLAAMAQWDVNSVNTTAQLPSGTIFNIVESVLNWLLALLGIFGIIGFVISGIIYLVSAGDEDTIERAKRAMTWSIIGVIVGLMGFVIIQAVNSMLGGSSVSF